ncbi:NAD(P)/FAD-dependent oxidoreductase [Saccharopolyspora endophytica]|uniref:FAD-dependent oxidoreductase n=1 Tax=Saccharopolyspora endophytica TaxID=543886 RepID=A0ABS5DKZ1_9PSEU|nr:FAD-dependent oxidoreductase [Saccharopolyspora endophytica]MBQ0926958.1 FAD-dependent oxidoreductase [Saccharopolyspora endophytica]
MRDDVVIVGACLAGTSTALELRSLGFDGAITMVGEEPHAPYDRPPLSKQFLTGGWDEQRVLLPGHDRLAELGIEFRPNTVAVGADLDGRAVTLDDGSELPFGDLVVATGVAPRPLPASGPAPLTLRSIADARRVAAELRPGRRVVVIGTGFMGTELAWAARAAGCEVAVVGVDPAPLSALGPEIGAVISRALTGSDVALTNSAGVTDIRAGARGEQEVLLDDGAVLRADVVVAAIGSVPQVDWLRGAGLDLSDGLGCDAKCRAAPGVYGVGDVARWWHTGLGRSVRVEHRMNAGEQARVVARNILGAEEDFAPIPFFWSDQGSNKLVVHGHVTAGAELELETGAFTDEAFAGVYRDEGRAVAVLSWNSPRRATRLRRDLLT